VSTYRVKFLPKLAESVGAIGRGFLCALCCLRASAVSLVFHIWFRLSVATPFVIRRLSAPIRIQAPPEFNLNLQ